MYHGVHILSFFFSFSPFLFCSQSKYCKCCLYDQFQTPEMKETYFVLQCFVSTLASEEEIRVGNVPLFWHFAIEMLRVFFSILSFIVSVLQFALLQLNFNVTRTAMEYLVYFFLLAFYLYV